VKTLLLALGLIAAQTAAALTPAELLTSLQGEASKHAGQAFTASVARGEGFFRKAGREWSCSSCHTDDPRKPGSHKVTGKAIKPMAPATNAERFTDRAKVDKWFRRNCKDVFARECTSAEQADVLAYLISLR
jgi:mono/diheme cytochrome c family protein